MNFNLITTLKSKKSVKKSFEGALRSYMKLREKTFLSLEIEKMKKKLKEIKKYSIDNIEYLLDKAKETLEKNSVEVFEAKNGKEAVKILKKLIPRGETIVKSKSNTLHEIGFGKEFSERNEIVETDCGEFILQVCGKKGAHPVTPAIHLTPREIAENLRRKFGVRLKPSAEEITKWVRNYLRKKILDCKIGLSGANAISADGGICILENEGNISLISRVPEKHVIVVGIEKVVPTLEDAMIVCKASAVWGTGTNLPTYINIISSPSKTADIQRKLVYGMHGAKGVSLIFVDNGRRDAIRKDLKEILYCINCGACLYFCPVYRQLFDAYGLTYLGGIGIAKSFLMEDLRAVFENGLYFCSTCMACKFNCPVGIDVPSLIRKIREFCVKKELETKTNKKMVENLETTGNPFGEVEEGAEIPEELFCC